MFTQIFKLVIYVFMENIFSPIFKLMHNLQTIHPLKCTTLQILTNVNVFLIIKNVRKQLKARVYLTGNTHEG